MGLPLDLGSVMFLEIVWAKAQWARDHVPYNKSISSFEYKDSTQNY